VTSSCSYRDQLRLDGFAIVPGLLDLRSVEAIVSSLDKLGESESVRRRGGVFGVRNLLEISPEASQLAEHPKVRQIVSEILGDRAFPVRGILFDKTPEANWKVPWHQDMTIAVAERREIPGFGPWTVKAGVLHVQPPSEVLEAMLTVRIHLDACGAENGALKVLSGSHRYGRMSAEEATRMVAERLPTICTMREGDALLMRPLLLHASSSSENPEHRRVIHIDFAATDLPDGLRWAGQTTVA
jgi:ectoine hydroxylase-related dioxygenase (phytanoyl-CoA dioxygenase family)